MSLNLPAVRLLKLTKGAWADVQYPVRVVVQAALAPQDYFEPVDPQAPRSCVPVGGHDFIYSFDSNSGKLVLRGPSMLPPMSVTCDINHGDCEIIFSGRIMQVSQSIGYEKHLDPLLTNIEHTIPALLSLVTGLSIVAETVEIALSDTLEARSETFLPPNQVRVIAPDARVTEISKAIQMLDVARCSSRFVLASSYLRDALFLDSTYNAHNPYMHSLEVTLKCAQAVEMLFGGRREEIRNKCRQLGITHDVIESHIIPIILARNELGSGHATAFVPNPREANILRHFAKASVHTVRQLLLHISKAEPETREFINQGVVKDNQRKKELLVELERSVKAPPWSVEGNMEFRNVLIPDPRLHRAAR